jgi:divalent metal cation (Fe/Co/Zn/Cd) transporter
MNDKTIDLLRDFGGEIKEALAQMASGLGVAAEHVYIVLVKQQVVYGIIALAWPILAMIAAGILTRYYFKVPFKNMRKGNFDGGENFVNDVIWVGAGLIAIGWIVLIVHSIMSLVNGVGHILNPEYYALKEIIHFIDEIKNGTPPPVQK